MTGRTLHPTPRTIHDLKHAKLKEKPWFTFVQSKATHGVKPLVHPSYFNMTVIPENWKALIFHTGSSNNYRSIKEHGLWAGEIHSRGGRQACFVSASDPQDRDSRWETDNYSEPENPP